MVELKNKVAIVTGASSGIGASIAQTLSSHGVNVVLSGRNESRLNDVADGLRTAGHSEVDTLVVDITDQNEVEHLVQFTKEKFGQVDILVNSAGQMLSSAITDGDVEAWNTMLDRSEERRVGNEDRAA